MNKLKHMAGFPRCYGVVYEGNKKHLVMQMLGASLADYLIEFDIFSLQHVAMIAKQVLKRLESMHDACFIHRDIKPDNILTGYKKKEMLYLV